MIRLKELRPQPGGAFEGRDQGTAAEGAARDQRALGGDRDSDQPENEQNAGPGEQPLEDSAVGQQRLVVVGIVAGVMSPGQILRRGTGQHRRRELSRPPDRVTRQQVGAQRSECSTAAAGTQPPGLGKPERVTRHAEDRCRLVQRRSRALGDEVEHRPQKRQRQVADQGRDHRPGWQVTQQSDQSVPAIEQPGTPPDRDRSPPLAGSAGVEHDGIGDHANPEAGCVHAPAEVDVLTEQRHARIEAADLLPDISPDEHPRAGNGEGIPVAVVLTLVDLARLDAGNPAPDGIDRHARLDDHVAVSPVHQLRAKHAGRRRFRGPAQQLLQRIGGRLAVVVQQPEPLDLVRSAASGTAPAGSPADAGRKRNASGLVRNRAPHRCRVTGTAVHPEHRALAELGGKHRAATVTAAGVHRHDPLDRPGLLVQRINQMLQPRGAVVRDDHRGYHVLGMGVSWRQGFRLCPGSLAGRVARGVPAGPGGGTREQYANLAQADGQSD